VLACIHMDELVLVYKVILVSMSLWRAPETRNGEQWTSMFGRDCKGLIVNVWYINMSNDSRCMIPAQQARQRALWWIIKHPPGERPLYSSQGLLKSSMISIRRYSSLAPPSDCPSSQTALPQVATSSSSNCSLACVLSDALCNEAEAKESSVDQIMTCKQM
jgi:hypothetical protein